MSRPHRFGSAVSAVVLASMIAGCAAPQVRTSFGGKADENVGLATKALMALQAKNVPAAIDLAERAVEQTPNDAGFRALLGNAYFAAGRFASAEGAYKDALTLYSNQPQVILKLALAQTALGKTDQAVAFLEAGRSVLDPSDYGLALSLAGRPQDAIPVLEAAARQPGADATVRQNLALAHALAGDWTEARTIAAQDVPANQLDSRIQQWMQLASPKSPAEQVASMIGVTPAPTDQGEPVRLALTKPDPKTDVMMAQSAPARPAAPAPQPRLAQAAPDQATPEVPAPKFAEAVAAPVPAPKPAPAVAAAPAEPKSLIEEASSVAVATSAMVATAAKKAEATVAAFLPKKAPAAKPTARHFAMAARANPGVVMQIGSYRTPQQVSAGWTHLTQRYPALRAYLPLRARFDSAKGTFWRLSVQGFGNEREAIARCDLLKSRGGHCFVRGVAGDAPVEMASN